MDPGKLRHWIEIQERVTAQDPDTGVLTETWPTFAEVFAQVEPLSARDFIAAAAQQSKVTARVTIRFLEGVKPSMRIIHGSHTYQIEAVLADPKSGIEYQTLPVSEVVSG